MYIQVKVQVCMCAQKSFLSRSFCTHGASSTRGMCTTYPVVSCAEAHRSLCLVGKAHVPSTSLFDHPEGLRPARILPEPLLQILTESPDVILADGF